MPRRPDAPTTEEHTLTRVDGSTLRVVFRAGPPIDDDRVDGVRLFAGRLWNALREGRVVLDRTLDELPLADFHLLRDLAERRGVIAAEPEEGRCRNCDALLEVDRRGAPLETLLDADPDDAPDEGPFELSRAVSGVVAIDQEPVSVAQARPLFRFLEDPSRPLDRTIVRALGVRALVGAKGRTSQPDAIARKLAREERLLALVETLYVWLNYPPRLRIPAFCSKCGAIHDVPTPSTRELDEDSDAQLLLEGRGDGPNGAEVFPTLAKFEELALRARDEVFAARHVANIELVIDDEVPPVDDGGEPLLGSYEPRYEDDGGGFTRVTFVISLYYRTFASMFDDEPYDVDAEVRETIDHEVEHHLHHLAGHDPLDEEERREARRDLERTFGKRTVERAEREALSRELSSIARFFFWGALLCGALLAGAIALGLVDL